jgi:hypothetical protein
MRDARDAGGRREPHPALRGGPGGRTPASLTP